MFPRTRYFFIYRLRYGEKLDDRLPIGGVLVHGWTEVSVIRKAFNEAYRRFPCKPQEYLAAFEQKDRIRRRQAMLMERDWERAQREFEELMTVS